MDTNLFVCTREEKKHQVGIDDDVIDEQRVYLLFIARQLASAFCLWVKRLRDGCIWVIFMIFYVKALGGIHVYDWSKMLAICKQH